MCCKGEVILKRIVHVSTRILLTHLPLLPPFLPPPLLQLFKKLGTAGFLGVNRDPAYGGLGLDYSYSIAMAEELGNIRCVGVPMAIGVQSGRWSGRGGKGGRGREGDGGGREGRGGGRERQGGGREEVEEGRDLSF